MANGPRAFDIQTAAPPSRNTTSPKHRMGGESSTLWNNVGSVTHMDSFLTRFGRQAPAVALIAGLAGMAINHSMHVESARYYLLLGVFCPICVVVGLFGIIDPRFYLAGSSNRPDVPTWCRLVGLLALALGLALTYYLNATLYRAYW